MATQYIKPLNGLKVRDPATGVPLPEAGAAVVWNSYWQRRLQEQSVQKVSTPSPKKTSKAKE